MSIAILFTVSALAQNAPPPSALTTAELRCEYRTNPLGIDILKPRLSWIVASNQRGQIQTAYRILVATDGQKLATNQGDLWDTGKVESGETTHIAYAGQPLTSRTRCHWKVRVWDKDGVPSGWSPPASWSMGLLGRTDWQATWIGYDTAALNEDPELILPPSPYLRKTFRVDKKVRRATVYATSLGIFELSLNGKRVGDDVFTPGWTDYNKRVHYHTYDVTDIVQQGDNALGAILSNGWYAGYVGFGLLQNRGKAGRAFYGEVPALLAQLEIEYEDGQRLVIAGDETWKASTGPIRGNDLQMGETYDARKEMPGWDTADFNDGAWQPAVVSEPYEGLVQAYPGVTVQATEELRPVAITQPKEGVHIFDMGQNFAGRVRLKVNGPSGTKIVLRFGEMLHEDGTLMTENLRRARAIDTYILRGGGDETWESRFTSHGFQYVEVTGYPGTPALDAITGVVLHSTTPQVGAFECDNPMVNQLYRNINWTQRANFIELPTDCPQRDERLGWTGDAQIYVRSATWNRDVAAFFTKWLVDLDDAQRPSGAFPDFAPLPYVQNEPSPGWMDAGIICPYTIYKVYGDTRVIECHYDAMQRQMKYLEDSSTDFLRKPVHHCWGDWLSVGEKTSVEFIATAYFAYDAKLMAEMAAAIGRDEDAKRYAQLFRNIKAAIADQWVSEDGRVKDDTQTTYALALYMDLLPEDMEQKAAGRLAELVKERDGHLATGFLGVKHLLPALSEHGHPDVAFRLLTNTTYPSWGYSVVNGATSIWERWNSYTKENGIHDPGMNSFSHYAFGAVCEWMFAYMAGIDTDGPGFKRIRVRPRPGGNDI
ncbi:MAG: family 78 glycoside hydrolase catalytic domain, partial [bacterium]|nr:family 78 glycoside hydrolase catalytic domain [bacterium]